jgi:hypothetical protein
VWEGFSPPVPVHWLIDSRSRLVLVTAEGEVTRAEMESVKFRAMPCQLHGPLAIVLRGENRVLYLLRRIVFMSCITVLAVLAWLPANAMTRTSLGGHAEHLIAYLATTLVMGLAFPGRPRLAVQGILLIGYAAILEVGQLQAVGRHASFDDFAFSAAGVAIGGLCLWIIPTVRRRALLP